MSAAVRVDGVLGSDFRPPELIVALCVALSVPVWSLVLLRLSDLAIQGNAPEIVSGEETPIQVTPVLDMESPLLKLGGGKKVRIKLPDMWKAPDPPPQAITKRRAHASDTAKDDAEEVPPDDLEMSDAGTPPDPDAGVVKDTEVEIAEAPDAGPIPEGEGSKEGVAEGTETDPLKARAANQYHATILRFLKGGFVCPKLGEGESMCSPTASVSISGGVVGGFSFSPCGDDRIDGPARASISSKVGQPLPPPPANYPDMMPNNFTVTYVCR